MRLAEAKSWESLRNVGLVLFVFFVSAALMAACAASAPGNTCNSDGDCPEGQFCLDGTCSTGLPEGGEPCDSDADCPGGYCDDEGACQTGARPCEDDDDCKGDHVCEDGACVEPPDTSCGTAYDCELEHICVDGECEPYDPHSACLSDDECPADHVCNMGECEGCLNDAFCIDSSNGPKCSRGGDDEPVPAGYCYVECGPDVGECESGYQCDEDRGGLCIPACQSNADCGQLVCDLDTNTCVNCTHDDECDEPRTCSDTGLCIDPPTGCTPGECASMGDAYFCDEVSGNCLLGCTQHTDCSGMDEPYDCNPCPSGSSCDTSTGNCTGRGDWPCDCMALDCGSYGQLCDASICECVTPPGSGAGQGQPCTSHDDCEGDLGCAGGDMMGGGGSTCQYICDMEFNGCACPPGTECSDAMGMGMGDIMCMMGMSGTCM